MWCGGHGLRYGTDHVPAMPLCTAHDHSPLLCRIRTAASVPLQPSQVAPNRVNYANDAPLRSTLSSKFVQERPSSTRDCKIEQDEQSENKQALVPRTVAGDPLQQRQLHCSNTELIATLSSLSVAPEHAVPAEPQWPRSLEGGTDGVADSNLLGKSKREKPERNAATASIKFSQAVLASVARGDFNGGSTSNITRSSSTSSYEAENLIRFIARWDLQQPQQPSITATATGCTTPLTASPSDSGAGSQLDPASLLRALDRLPDTPAGPTGNKASLPAALGTTALLGPGGGTVINPGSIQSVDSHSPDPNPSFQNFQIHEALRGLFSVVAPASSLSARPESSRSGAQKYGSRAMPAPTSPSGLEARLQNDMPLKAPPVRPGTETATEAASPSLPITPLEPASSAPGTAISSLQDVGPGDTVSAWQHQQPGERMAMGSSMGTHYVGSDPAAVAPLLYAAAGVTMPPWAAVLLPPPEPGHQLDPSLEWALGVLSSRITSRDPRQGELRLANRILAANLGPPRVVRARGATGVAGAEASRISGRGVSHWDAQHSPLPWPLLLPVLDAVAGRLSPVCVLALLRAISCQVGSHWRRDLARQEQARLVATLRICFRAALKSPDAVSASAAAGLMEVMCRLRVRSEPACSLLVARILTGVVPIWRAMAPLRSPSSPSLAQTASAEQVSPPTAEHPLSDGALQVPSPVSPAPMSIHSVQIAGGSSNSSNSSSGDAGQDRGRRPRVRVATRVTRGRLGRSSSKVVRTRAGRTATRLMLGPSWRRSQLRWACVAMSTLARLRISRFSLPQRALTKLLWAALFASAHWTPGIAAALPVWAARLDYPPPAAFLRRYSKALMGTSARASTSASDSTSRERQRRKLRLQRRRGRQSHGADAAAATTSSGRDRSGTSSGTSHSSRCLVDRMTAPQLAAAMEALLEHYGPCTARPEAVAVAAADSLVASGPYRGLGHIFTSCTSGGGDRSSSSRSGGGGGVRDTWSQDNNGIGLSSTSRRLALRYGDYRDLMHVLAAALFSRLRQLRWQQLCRLPLLLYHVGPPLQDGPRGGQWQQVFVLQTRRLLPSCDVVDLMLLLRGLAALSTSTPGQPGADRGSVSKELATALPGTYHWLSSELADDALRRYATLLPSASLHHTAAVLESLSLLWGRPPHPPQATELSQPLEQSSGDNSASWRPPPMQPPPRSSTPSLPPTTATTSAATSAVRTANHDSRAATRLESAGLVSVAAANTQPPPGSSMPALPSLPINHESELRQRRLVDLASEREFLMQQLDEHVATCLSFSNSRRRREATNRRRGSKREGRVEAPVRVPVGVLAKVLAAYSRLQRPPHPRLQGALEAALVERADALGTSGWQRVRAVYQQLQLQPGPDLSVALLTFA